MSGRRNGNPQGIGIDDPNRRAADPKICVNNPIRYQEFSGEVVSDFKRRAEGVPIKHSVLAEADRGIGL